MKLTGKVALVTGAGKGIGRGIAKAFAAEGCNLMLTARTQVDLESVADELADSGVDVGIATADVADADRMGKIFEQLKQRFGRLDLLVNNAGAFDGGPLDELSLEDWDRVIATNLRGPFICTQHAMRIMKEQSGGRIINVGSISGQRVRYSSAPYSTSKHGIWGLTQVTALEGRDHGITCCCLCPGNILTERRDASDADADQEPMIRVEDISEVALLMATLPPNVEMLEAIVLPHQQLYVGRG
jgi:NAD(P)-dependent dehydrogenase (short-subunit alcohol dehydrogenase family)